MARLPAVVRENFKALKKNYNIKFRATSSAKITTVKGEKLAIILSYKQIVENKEQVNKHTAYYFLLTSSKNILELIARPDINYKRSSGYLQIAA